MMGNMPTTTSSSSSSSSTSMMQMAFTNDFRDIPVLFSGLKASTNAQAFGIFCLIVFIAIILRGLMFLYGYLETEIWSMENLSRKRNQKPATIQFGFDDENDYKDENESNNCHKQVEEQQQIVSKTSSSLLGSNIQQLQHGNKINIKPLFFTTWKDFEGDMVRLILSFLIALFAYALMLITMTFVTCYFFAVVLGMALGEVWFRRWSFAISNKPSTSIGCNIPASFT